MSFTLLGILSSAGAGGAAAAGSFDLLETQVLASSAASVTFSSLSTYAADYQHLQIRLAARGTRNANGDNLGIRFNGDTGANYARHSVYGQGSGVVTYGAGSQTFMDLAQLASSTTAANTFTGGVADILDPFETSKNTTIKTLSGVPASAWAAALTSGAWFNTNALTSMTIYALNGNLVTGSRFSLYGIRGG